MPTAMPLRAALYSSSSCTVPSSPSATDCDALLLNSPFLLIRTPDFLSVVTCASDGVICASGEARDDDKECAGTNCVAGDNCCTTSEHEQKRNFSSTWLLGLLVLPAPEAWLHLSSTSPADVLPRVVRATLTGLCQYSSRVRGLWLLFRPFSSHPSVLGSRSLPFPLPCPPRASRCRRTYTAVVPCIYSSEGLDVSVTLKRYGRGSDLLPPLNLRCSVVETKTCSEELHACPTGYHRIGANICPETGLCTDALCCGKERRSDDTLEEANSLDYVRSVLKEYIPSSRSPTSKRDELT